MTGRLIDALAARAARAPLDESGDRLTRNALARRGLLGALALGSLGRLLFPDNALGASCPGGSLEACRDRADGVYRFSLDACDDPDEAYKLRCYRKTHASRKKQRRSCDRGCPKPRRSKPPSKPKAPPSLPPNPYGPAIDDYCGPEGACAAVGGECCGPPSGTPGVNVCLAKSQCRQ
jgi:hypothetical protein